MAVIFMDHSLKKFNILRILSQINNRQLVNFLLQILLSRWWSIDKSRSIAPNGPHLDHKHKKLYPRV